MAALRRPANVISVGRSRKKAALTRGPAVFVLVAGAGLIWISLGSILTPWGRALHVGKVT